MTPSTPSGEPMRDGDRAVVHGVELVADSPIPKGELHARCPDYPPLPPIGDLMGAPLVMDLMDRDIYRLYPSREPLHGTITSLLSVDELRGYLANRPATACNCATWSDDDRCPHDGKGELSNSDFADWLIRQDIACADQRIKDRERKRRP